jgi:hypothetical protein
MYVCILYQVESQYIANLYKSMIEGPQTQLHHGIRRFTRHHRPQDEQIIRLYSADVLRPSIRTGWVLKMSPSDHYWRRYVVGQWLVLGWFWGCDAPDTRLVRRKLGKKNTAQPWRPPSSYGRHGAPLPAPQHTADSPHIGQQVDVVLTRKFNWYYYLLAM